MAGRASQGYRPFLATEHARRLRPLGRRLREPVRRQRRRGCRPQLELRAPAARSMEADGVVAEVIFPNTVPPFFPKGSLVEQPPGASDGDLAKRWAGLQAHNRWLADFCSQAPGRRAGIAQIMLHDVDASVREIEWAKAQRPDRRDPAARRAARLGRAAALRPRLRADLGGMRGPRHADQPPQRQRRAGHGPVPRGPDDVPARGHLVGAPGAVAPRLLRRDGAPPGRCSSCSPSRARRGSPKS